jgi:hypothetical protein
LLIWFLFMISQYFIVLVSDCQYWVSDQIEKYVAKIKLIQSF